ncbi:hypothetical protein B0T25DRAFT_152005 [Lasiosphaeria hispida]|uniref:Uncharacterized protein n=1 Tax=Lasiosphaeria hispida TaxID=260671 RepID=A0AAJ0MG05_9PEZI|nr:hypothetical protein B0T25DRAFT_152005 [Lasiosphaeria hispida]
MTTRNALGQHSAESQETHDIVSAQGCHPIPRRVWCLSVPFSVLAYSCGREWVIKKLKKGRKASGQPSLTLTLSLSLSLSLIKRRTIVAEPDETAGGGAWVVLQSRHDWPPARRHEPGSWSPISLPDEDNAYVLCTLGFPLLYRSRVSATHCTHAAIQAVGTANRLRLLLLLLGCCCFCRRRWCCGAVLRWLLVLDLIPLSLPWSDLQCT